MAQCTDAEAEQTRQKNAKFATDAICFLLAFIGARDEADGITNRFAEQIRAIVNKATKLNRVMGRDVISTDMTVVHLPPGADCDLELLEDGKETDRIICTTDLGLVGFWRHERKILLKARALLESGIVSDSLEAAEGKV